jgi:hypothetical protein
MAIIIDGTTGIKTDAALLENGQVINTNYTVTVGKNAGAFGPLEVLDGVTLTVPDGSTLSIV